jgi:hypothetical protein
VLAVRGTIAHNSHTIPARFMSIFQKLFGGSSKQSSGSGQWDAVLAKTDLLMARDEIASMHRMLNAQGEKEGGAYYFKNDYVAAWEAFRDAPTVNTARALLDVAPLATVFRDVLSRHRLPYDWPHSERARLVDSTILNNATLFCVTR